MGREWEVPPPLSPLLESLLSRTSTSTISGVAVVGKRKDCELTDMHPLFYLSEDCGRVRRAVEGGGQTVGNSLFINVKAQRHHKGRPSTELASLLSLPIHWGNCKHSDKKNQAPYPAVYPLQGSSHFHVMSSMCRLHFERHKARPFSFLFKQKDW